MTKYYIKSNDENGYVEVPNSQIVMLLEKSTINKYLSDCYANRATIEDVPEVYREEVRCQLDEMISKHGKYEDQPIPSYELSTLVENLPKSKLTRASAKTLCEDIDRLRNGVDDSVASTAVSVFPQLKYDSSLIKVGTRINYGGVIKRAAVDLWDTAENSPDNAPTLWEDLLYRDGYRFIPETITVGTAFTKDECGWWNDTLYVSLIDNNVWNPSQYPAGWEVK